MDPLSGGPCQGIRNCHPAFSKLGIYEEVVCLDDPSVSYPSGDTFPIHRLGPAKGAWQYNKNLLYWLRQNLQRFDVILVNGLWLYHGFAVRKAMRYLQQRNLLNEKRRLPKVFVMPHGMLDPYFQKAESRKLKAIRNEIYWRLIEAKLVNGAHGLLFTCEAELLLARQPFTPYAPKKEFNVGYGVIEPPSYTTQMKEPFLKHSPNIKGENYLLFLSRVHEKKGVDLLIAAYQHVKNRRSGERQAFPKLVIVGPGLETAYGKKMVRLVEETEDLKSCVFFTGMLEGDAKWGAFYGCEAFILPSHQENFGIAVVEALACSKPVLISYEVNISKEIEATGGGIIAKDTLAGTTELLEGWLKLSLAEKEEMCHSAKRTFKKYFDIEAVSHSFRNALCNQLDI
jgi:glycosyltransferase involved in cell wall biosynthesis